MNLIKQTLEQKGISQTWLSKKLGKSFNMVNSYCQNKIQPSLKTLYKIAKILQVEPAELLKKE